MPQFCFPLIKVVHSFDSKVVEVFKVCICARLLLCILMDIFVKFLKILLEQARFLSFAYWVSLCNPTQGHAIAMRLSFEDEFFSACKNFKEVTLCIYGVLSCI